MASRLFAKLSRIRSIAPVNLKTSVPRCSAYAYFPLTFGPTTDRSSSPRQCRNGSRLSVPRSPTSSEAAPGRTATSRASTLACATSCLDGEIFSTLREAQIVIESWRRHYNTIRPHASLGYKPPAPEVFVPAFAAWPAALRQPAPPATLAQRPALN